METALKVLALLSTANFLKAHSYTDGGNTSSPVPAVTEDSGGGSCPPIPGGMTALKTGRKAWDKCIEYQELVYPCVESSSLIDADAGKRVRVRADHCGHSALPLLSDEPIEKEFPHMVMLGYGADVDKLEWLCGGTLISEYFVVTAAHCIFSREFGNVTHVHTAAFQRSKPVDSGRTYTVADTIRHPRYKPSSKYYDIALLKTARQMLLDEFAVPACLDIGSEPAGERAVATGWGPTFNSDPDKLQKLKLQKLSREQCRMNYHVRREEFQESLQLCYGDLSQDTNNCQGDSGGPLQTYNKLLQCMYWLVGVTSVGKPCGFIDGVGFYTRVAEFTPWIESIVWP